MTLQCVQLTKQWDGSLFSIKSVQIMCLDLCLQCWLQLQVFQGYSFDSCSVQSNIQAFPLTGLLWWQKLLWFVQQFLYDLWILQFNSALSVSFHNFHEKAIRVKFDSGMIFLDQPQFFASHNQWDCFILCRQQIHQMAVFTFGWLSSNEIF